MDLWRTDRMTTDFTGDMGNTYRLCIAHFAIRLATFHIGQPTFHSCQLDETLNDMDRMPESADGTRPQ